MPDNRLRYFSQIYFIMCKAELIMSSDDRNLVEAAQWSVDGKSQAQIDRRQ
jgi:hypothetical protein